MPAGRSRLLDVIVVFGVLICSDVASADPPSTPNAATELQRLQGVWIGIYGEESGEELLVDPDFPSLLFISKHKFQFTDVYDAETLDTRSEAGFLTIDPVKSPRELDWTAFWDGRKRGTQPGIYKLEGNTLTIVLGPSDGPRPTKFTTKGAQVMWKFQRYVLNPHE